MEYYYLGVLQVSFAYFSGNGNYTVITIELNKKGSSTPDGVSVSMEESCPSDVHITTDGVWIMKYVSQKFFLIIGEKNQLRFTETTYAYHFNVGLSMSFIV